MVMMTVPSETRLSAYSPDQERDDHGRFGSGDGGGNAPISRAEAKEWVGDQGAITYHVTSTDAKDAMTKDGIDVTKGGGAFGQGFYTADKPDTKAGAGSEKVAVAIRMENPITVTARDEAHSAEYKEFKELAAEHLGDKYDPSGMRQALLGRGYDGIIVPGSGKTPTWRIAIKEGSAKVVKDEPKKTKNLLGYSPDQERDDNGRFAGGDGETSGGDARGPITTADFSSYAHPTTVALFEPGVTGFVLPSGEYLTVQVSEHYSAFQSDSRDYNRDDKLRDAMVRDGWLRVRTTSTSMHIEGKDEKAMRDVAKDHQDIYTRLVVDQTGTQAHSGHVDHYSGDPEKFSKYGFKALYDPLMDFVTIRAALIDYSEDQERDDHGRFAGGSADDAREALPQLIREAGKDPDFDRFVPKELFALDFYSWQGSNAVNQYLTTGKLSKAAEKMGERIDFKDSRPIMSPVTAVTHLDSAMSKSSLDRDTLVYRGLKLDAPLRVGDTLEHQGFVSTTTKMDYAAKFAGTKPGGTLLEIRAQKSLPALKGNNSEKEVLLPRSLGLKIVGSRKETYTTRVWSYSKNENVSKTVSVDVLTAEVTHVG